MLIFHPNASFYENHNIFPFINEMSFAFDNMRMPWPMVMSGVDLTYITQKLRMKLCTRRRSEELRVRTD